MRKSKKSTSTAAPNPGHGLESNALKVEASLPWTAQVWEYGKIIALSVVLALLIRSFIVQAFHIPSGSMIPTFLEGDRVLVNKFSFGIRNPFTNGLWIEVGQPKRGDVVVFKYPDNPQTDFVKRVIGLPGEKVEIVASQVFIDGSPIPDPHAFFRMSELPAAYRNFGPIVVPPNAYFMMGDNRDQSNDSRAWGCVSSSLLRGKVWRIYWSWTPDKSLPFHQRLRFNRLGKKVE
ncbi:MAG: signal peptidase I [Deltaproteobacteria bacterium]|jgi:signal peptidase I|nr:signal peptidase I [Deltaproteobacteria bacterium]